MKKFQGSSLYLTPEGLRDQTGEIILTKREILDELVGPGAEAPLPEGREQECETCHGDPDGLRHCEAAVRQEETRRTDEATIYVSWDIDSQSMAGIYDEGSYVKADFARQLERELNAMQIAYAALCSTGPQEGSR